MVTKALSMDRNGNLFDRSFGKLRSIAIAADRMAGMGGYQKLCCKSSPVSQFLRRPTERIGGKVCKEEEEEERWAGKGKC